MSVPAHKVVGDDYKPGQLTFDRYPYLKHSTADQTLGDYLARKRRYDALDTVALEKVNNVKKLTFEQWYKQCMIDFNGRHPSAETVWKAAQENV